MHDGRHAKTRLAEAAAQQRDLAFYRAVGLLPQLGECPPHLQQGKLTSDTIWLQNTVLFFKKYRLYLILFANDSEHI
jgi:hypothetical protein